MYTMGALDKRMIWAKAGWSENHHTTQNDTQSKTYELLLGFLF